MALTRVTKTRELTVDGKMTQLTRGGGSHKVLHRHWMDYRNVGDGTYDGYILLCPAHPGSGNVDATEVSGTFRWSRGSQNSGNRGGILQVLAKTAYSDDALTVTVIEASNHYDGQYKVTYNGQEYLALKFSQGGGGAHNGVYFDGYTQGTDIPLIMVRGTEVTNPVAYGGSYAAKPALRINATDRTQIVEALNSPIFDGSFSTGGAQSLDVAIGISQLTANGITLNGAGNRLTVPVEGYYFVHGAQLAQPAAGNYAYFSIVKNGTTMYHSHNNFYSETNKDFYATKILHMQANDYIEFKWLHGGAPSNSWAGAHSTVSMHKLG